MILLYCRKRDCYDIVRIGSKWGERSCHCGAVRGYYDENGEVHATPNAVPLGIDVSSKRFLSALDDFDQGTFGPLHATIVNRDAPYLHFDLEETPEIMEIHFFQPSKRSAPQYCHLCGKHVTDPIHVQGSPIAGETPS